MQFIGDHFWKLIFLIILTFAGVWTYQRHDRQQTWQDTKERYRTTYQEIPTTPESDDADCKAKYLAFLAMVHQFQVNLTNEHIVAFPPAAEKYSENKPSIDDRTKWMLDGALGLAEDTPRTPLAEIVHTSILKNLKICQQFGIFEAEENMERMLEGKNPLISKGSFEGEPLVVVQRIPVFAAREAAHHPANYSLLPESLAAVQAANLDEGMRSLAEQFKRASVLSTKSYDQFKSLLDLTKP